MNEVQCNPFRASSVRFAVPIRDAALFLDLDGTLLDLAPTPADVTVPSDLVVNLKKAADMLCGALAIISGRTLVEIDGLISPLKLPAAGEHGAVIRLADGTYDELEANFPRAWLETIVAALGGVEGLLIEEKTHGVAIHFRQAPGEARRVHEIATSLVSLAPDRFEVLPAHMAFEIRSHAATKGRAVIRLMNELPFRGRTPIYVGDDVSDEAGVNVAKALGGIGLRVDEAFGGRPSLVRSWLGEIAALGRAVER